MAGCHKDINTLKDSSGDIWDNLSTIVIDSNRQEPVV